ncbi:MAG: PadR family transcriptional regulator [Proteobacteria bacterium]|nr:PadR family transcriptional regulator [Pseudomonadota bacterium]
MTDKALYGGFVRLHTLHHAAEDPVFGPGIIEKLRHRSYALKPKYLVTDVARSGCGNQPLLSVKLTLRKLRCERFNTLGHLPGQLGQMGILFQ